MQVETCVWKINEASIRCSLGAVLVLVRKRESRFTLNKGDQDVIQHARRIEKWYLWVARQIESINLLVFALFRVHSARAGASTTLGRSTPSCRRLVVRVRVLKKGGAKVCRSNIARGWRIIHHHRIGLRRPRQGRQSRRLRPTYRTRELCR